MIAARGRAGRVSAGMSDHTETMRFPVSLPGVTQRFPILSVFPHMHYVGYDLEVKTLRQSPAEGEPSEECPVKVPRWNFAWQRTYQYDTALDQLPTVGDGDELTIRCHYDNTEMCLAAFGVVFDTPAAPAARLLQDQLSQKR